MKIKKMLGTVAVVATVAVLSACGTVSDTSSSSDTSSNVPKDVKEVTIGFLQRQVDAPYYAAMQAEAEKLAKDQGFKLLFQNAAGDPVAQLDQAQTLLTQGVDVLIVNAISPDTEKDQLLQIAGEVPLLFIDTSIPDVGFTAVGSNNEQIGQDSGKLAGARFPKDSAIDVAIINGGPNDEIVGPARQKGFLAGLQSAGLTYNVVAEAVGAYSQDKAVPATESVLAAHPDVDLILGLNDAMALGALTVLGDQKNTTTLVAGVDGQKEAFQEIAKGCDSQYAATGLNSPSAATDRAFEIAIQVATGEKNASDFDPIEYIKGAGVDCNNVADYYDAKSVF